MLFHILFYPRLRIKVHRKLVYKDVIYLYKLSNKVERWHKYTQTAAAKSLQSCPTLCDPIDGSPLGSSVSGIFQAGIVEWVAISFSKVYMCVCKYVTY